MTTLNLPKFNIPELPPKHLTPKAYQAWVFDNLKRLHANGQLARLLVRTERRPTDKRFVIPSPPVNDKSVRIGLIVKKTALKSSRG